VIHLLFIFLTPKHAACGLGCLSLEKTDVCATGKTDTGSFCSAVFQYPVFLCVVRSCDASDAQHAVPALASYGCCSAFSVLRHARAGGDQAPHTLLHCSRPFLRHPTWRTRQFSTFLTSASILATQLSAFSLFVCHVLFLPAQGLLHIQHPHITTSETSLGTRAPSADRLALFVSP
jgi:hypothetical protein